MAWFKQKTLKDGSQLWILAWRAGSQVYSKKVARVPVPVAKPPKGARLAKAAVESELARSPFSVILPPKTTLAEFVEKHWTAQRAADPSLSPKTLFEEQRVLGKHILPRFGPVQLGRISPADVETFLGEVSASSTRWIARRIRFLLHAVFEKARQLRFVAENPVAHVRLSPPRSPERPLWDVEQTKLFLGEAKRSSPGLYPLFLLAVTSGMRIGELLALRRSDLNLMVGIAQVNRSLLRVDKQMIFKEPKTKASRRTVALSPLVVESLRQHLNSHKHELVFAQPDGKPLHAHNLVQRDFRQVLELRGLRKDLATKGLVEESLPKPLPRIRFHDLRHLSGTLLHSLNVPVKVVQERLGHSSPRITMEVYTHSMGGAQAIAARLLEEQLLGGGIQ